MHLSLSNKQWIRKWKWHFLLFTTVWEYFMLGGPCFKLVGGGYLVVTWNILTCEVSSWRKVVSSKVSFTSSTGKLFVLDSAAKSSKQSSSLWSRARVCPRQSSALESFSTLSAAATRWFLSPDLLTWRIETELARVIVPMFLAMFRASELTSRLEISSSCRWLTFLSL